MKLGLTFIQLAAQQNEVRRAADAAAQGFAPGILAPTEVDLEQSGIGARERAARAACGQLIAREPGVAAVIGPREQVPGAPAAVVSRDGGGARATRSSSTRTRSARRPSTACATCATGCPRLMRAAGLGPGVQVGFGGETALADDTITRVLDDLKRVAVVAIVVNVVLLALFMRALVAPLYLVASSVLGLLASLGLTTLLFQKVLGNDDLTYYVPFAAAVLLVALGSDYNVFVAGRIWEEARRYRLREAIAVADAGGRAGRDRGRARARGLVRAAGDRPAALVPRVRVRDGRRACSSTRSSSARCWCRR